MQPGILITFEGYDGVLKATQIRLLAERLRQENKDVFDINKTDVTEVCESIREILLHKEHVSICPETELLLFGASRAQLVYEVILPALQKGKIVLYDSYMDSTTVYEDVVRHFSDETIKIVNKLILHRIRPDITFVFCNPFKICSQQILQSNLQEVDRMDDSYISYQSLRNGYLKSPDTMRVINEGYSQQEITDTIWETVKELLEKKEL